jgi:hypothetical protein
MTVENLGITQAITCYPNRAAALRVLCRISLEGEEDDQEPELPKESDLLVHLIHAKKEEIKALKSQLKKKEEDLPSKRRIKFFNQNDGMQWFP